MSSTQPGSSAHNTLAGPASATAVSSAAAPAGSTSGNSAHSGLLPGNTVHGYHTAGHTAPGHPTVGHATHGHPTLGNPTLGHTNNGHATQGHAMHGHATHGHATHGNPVTANAASANSGPTSAAPVAPHNYHNPVPGPATRATSRNIYGVNFLPGRIIVINGREYDQAQRLPVHVVLRDGRRRAFSPQQLLQSLDWDNHAHIRLLNNWYRRLMLRVHGPGYRRFLR